MNGFQLQLMGNWAHFKKPETNNNPLTHDIIPKTALLGLIGAVLGIERREMRAKFPQFSEVIQIICTLFMSKVYIILISIHKSAKIGT